MKNKYTLLLVCLLVVFSIFAILCGSRELVDAFMDITCISKNVIF